MNEGFEEDENDALSAMANAPPHRKAHSYSQQLRTNTGTHIKRHQLRKHSLDETNIPNNVDRYYDSSDDDFYPYATLGGGGTGVGEHSAPMGSIHMNDNQDHYNINYCTDGSNELQQQEQPLPEFVGNGGDVGIFKVPCRAGVHPGRPPCLELRPHPLRETQVGRFLRTIACTETQLWAGQESGVRVWNFSDAYEPGSGIGGRTRRGDEDAAPFYESANTSPTICLVIDRGSNLVWSGHKDGKIRSWKMDQQKPMDDTPFKEGLTWQAHRGPVLSMVISSYGKLLQSFITFPPCHII